MSDYNSSLPIRTESAGDAIVKVADATVPSQQLTVNSDGSVNITDNSGSITVDATNLDIRDLSAAQDNVAVSDGTDTLAINADGSINITDNGGSLTVDATDLDIRDLSSAQDSVQVLQATHDNLNLNANLQVGNTDVANGNPVPVSDAGGSLTVDSTDLDIRDLTHVSDSVKVGDGTEFIAVNTDGSINVKIVDKTPGTSINDYNTVAAVAAAASSTHTYTATGNFNLTQIEASASGKMKIEVVVNGVSKFVQFNSTSTPNMTIQLSQVALITTGQTIEVIRTNRDNQPMDVYSTISGYNE